MKPLLKLHILFIIGTLLGGLLIFIIDGSLIHLKGVFIAYIGFSSALIVSIFLVHWFKD